METHVETRTETHTHITNDLLDTKNSKTIMVLSDILPQLQLENDFNKFNRQCLEGYEAQFVLDYKIPSREIEIDSYDFGAPPPIKHHAISDALYPIDKDR